MCLFCRSRSRCQHVNIPSHFFSSSSFLFSSSLIFFFFWLFVDGCERRGIVIFFRVRKKQVVCLAWRVVFCFLYLGYLFMWLYTWTSWSACIHTYTVCNISASLSLCVYIYLSIMYVSMHLHVFVCMQGVCTSVPCINVPTCMYIHMQGVCTSVYKCTSVYVHTFKRVCISPCMYVRHSVSILYTHPTVVFLQARDCRAMSVHAPGPCSHECPSINLSYETYLL